MPSKNSHRKSLMVSVCNYFLMIVMIVSIFFIPNMVSSAYAEKRFYSLHVSSFKNLSNAVKEVNKLKRSGHHAFYRHETVNGKGKWYRVYIGKFVDKEEARKLGSELKEKGLVSYFMPMSIDRDIKVGQKGLLPEKDKEKHIEPTDKKKPTISLRKQKKHRKMKLAQSTVVTKGKGIVAVHAAPVGKFSHVEGRVDITSPGQAARPVHIGDEIYIKDIIRSKSKSKAEIIFIDDAMLQLAQKTRVEITEYFVGKERTSGILKLHRGKIQNKVKKVMGRLFGLKERNRFEVHTPTFAVGVRDTEFFTYYQKELKGAIFIKGRGYGYSLNLPDVIKEITVGQAMVVVSPDIPPTIRPATPVEIQKHTKDTAPSEKSEEVTEAPAGEALYESDVGSSEAAASTEEVQPTEPEPSVPTPPEATVRVKPETAPEIPVTETDPEIFQRETNVNVDLEWENNNKR